MKKIILTANGLENKNIGRKLLEMINKIPGQIRAIFVPTAANDADAIEVLPKCMHDLLDLGIPSRNITVYDLHYNMVYEDLCKFDVIYFCGGSPQYLLKRINETGFNKNINKFVDNGGIYIGVSAGSVIVSNNLPNNLGYLNCKLDVHGKEGINIGKFDPSKCSHIILPDYRAIIIEDNIFEVIE
jgi:peptidase E